MTVVYIPCMTVVYILYTNLSVEYACAVGLTPSHASPTQSAQLCMHMSFLIVTDTYIHNENRSLIQSLTLMCSAIMLAEGCSYNIISNWGLYMYVVVPYHVATYLNLGPLPQFPSRSIINVVKEALCRGQPWSVCGMHDIELNPPSAHLATPDQLFQYTLLDKPEQLSPYSYTTHHTHHMP